jgi:hypothetical protein
MCDAKNDKVAAFARAAAEASKTGLPVRANA